MFLKRQRQQLEQSYREKEAALEQAYKEKTRDKLYNLERSYQEKKAALDDRSHHINDEVRNQVSILTQSIASRPYLSGTPTFRALQVYSPDTYSRLFSSLNQSMSIVAPFDISACILSSSGNKYRTTLYSCTCPDFAHRSSPCKHMLRLAAEVCLLLHFDTSDLKSDVSQMLAERSSLSNDISELSSEISAAQQQLTSLRDNLASLEEFLSHTEHNVQSQPWLSALYADYLQFSDDDIVDTLKYKKRPAELTAERANKIINGELREYRIRAKSAEYQLNFYESLFPWLLEFKEIPSADAVSLVSDIDRSENDDGMLIRSGYLSIEEYEQLSVTERNQLALDRYIRSEKSSWQVGIEYERYIGYLCEQEGYSVRYNGAVSGFQDMGRDLILEKGDTVVVVQCKRWAKEKTIHENHVFQLAGSVFEYRHKHPNKTVLGAFVSTVSFSPVAAECGELLGLRLYPNTPFHDYPRIKCNIGKDGEKIYHLPMDQQYDHILIDKPGEFYAATVAEAEAAGFRRAYHWHSQTKE